MTHGAVLDLADKFAGLSDPWRPRIAARLNGQDARLVKVLGVFPWHSHAEADEEAEVLIFEPSEVVNTGDAAVSDFTDTQGQTI